MRDVNEHAAARFREVYARHYPDVVRYGLRRLDGLTAAEELAQEVFLVAWRRRAELPARALPWLYGWLAACWPITGGHGGRYPHSWS